MFTCGKGGNQCVINVFIGVEGQGGLKKFLCFANLGLETDLRYHQLYLSVCSFLLLLLDIRRVLVPGGQLPAERLRPLLRADTHGHER